MDKHCFIYSIGLRYGETASRIYKLCAGAHTKNTKRPTKLTKSLKHLPYIERLKQLILPTLKYICLGLHGDMIEVFIIVHNFYDSESAVKLNFNICSTVRKK